jgi:hypothetical protein
MDGTTYILHVEILSSPHSILPCHHYLFTSRSLAQRLRLDYDSLSCWIRSVEEAQQALLQMNLMNEAIEEKRVRIEHIRTKKMVAYGFTKPLEGADFTSFQGTFMGNNPV